MNDLATPPPPAETARRGRRRRPWGRCYPRPGGPGWLVQYPDPSGRRAPSGRTKYVTRSVVSKAEGEALLKELRKAAITGTLASPEPPTATTEMTVAEAVEAHRQAVLAAGGSAKTVEVYATACRAFERHGIAHGRVADLTAESVERYLRWRRDHAWRTEQRVGGKRVSVAVKNAQTSASTLARERALLRAALGRLVRLGALAENVVARVPKPRPPKGTRIVLTKDEIARLLAACGPQLFYLVLMAVHCGGRRGELLRLTWGDVTLDGDTPRLALLRPKVGTFSYVPLHPVVVAKLRELREKRAAESGGEIAPTESLLVSRYGRPWKDFRGAWNAALRRAGLAGRRGVTFHSLRHSFATHYLGHGGTVPDLMALLGHSQMATTQIYARMVDARMKAGVEALRFGNG